MDEGLERQLILRFALATFLEAVRLYEEGMASIDDIDVAMQAGAGLKQGPFHWADGLGLDVVLEDLNVLCHTVSDRFSPPTSLIDRVQRGQLGVKTGQGYLAYERRATS